MTDHMTVQGAVKYQGDPYTIELARGQRGGYGWTIKVRGEDRSLLLIELRELDAQLRQQYQSNASE